MDNLKNKFTNKLQIMAKSKYNFNKIDEKLRKIVKNLSFFKVDFSFGLLFVLALFLDSIKVYFIYIVFLFFHELCHFFVAKKFGYMPEKVHLSFFGASLEGYDDFNFYDEIKIVLAGPVFNLFVVVICYVLFWLFPEISVVFNDILYVNLSILLFNILPIYPLDMGRFLLAKFSKSSKRSIALKKVKIISMWFIFILFGLFLFSFFFKFNFSLGFVCLNLMFLLFSTSKSTSYKRQFFVQRKLEKLSTGLFEKTIYVSEMLEHFKLFKFIDNTHYFKFVFLNRCGDKVREISEIELYRENNLI